MSRVVIDKITECRTCDAIVDCTPTIIVIMSLITASIGLGILVSPGLMAESRSMSDLLLWMPQWAWGVTLLTIAGAKVVTLFFDSEPVRLSGLAAGIVIWSHMASVTASQAVYALGPWIYFPLALVNALTLTFVAWDMGKRRAGK